MGDQTLVCDLQKLPAVTITSATAIGKEAPTKTKCFAPAEITEQTKPDPELVAKIDKWLHRNRFRLAKDSQRGSKELSLKKLGIDFDRVHEVEFILLDAGWSCSSRVRGTAVFVSRK